MDYHLQMKTIHSTETNMSHAFLEIEAGLREVIDYLENKKDLRTHKVEDVDVKALEPEQWTETEKDLSNLC